MYANSVQTEEKKKKNETQNVNLEWYFKFCK